jgi:hypothetical protein
MRLRMLAGAAAASLVSVTLISAPAQAAPVTCEVTPAAGQGTINVRNSPTTSSAIVDYLQPGEFMESGCSGQSGGYYNACGGASTSWVPVHIGLFYYGYVARRCVRLYQWQ